MFDLNHVIGVDYTNIYVVESIQFSSYEKK